MARGTAKALPYDEQSEGDLRVGRYDMAARMGRLHQAERAEVQRTGIIRTTSPGDGATSPKFVPAPVAYWSARYR